MIVLGETRCIYLRYIIRCLPQKYVISHRLGFQTHRFIIHSFWPVFFSALLAVLNAREKLARLELDIPIPDLRVYRPTTSSGENNPGPWSKVAGILPFPSAGMLKEGKVVPEERVELPGRPGPTMFGRSGRWESNAYINTVNNTNGLEDAYPTSTTGMRKKVSSIIGS